MAARSRPVPRHACPFVSVLIVSYNGRRHLDRCLRALAGQTFPRDRWEVVLVDNASADGTDHFVRARFPWVRVVRAPRNLGFAAGNNLGFRHSRGGLIALLNNDTVADPCWLERLVEGLGGDPRVGGVASKLLFLREPGRINSAGLELYRDGRGGDRGFRQPDAGQFDEPTEVFGGSGAGLLLRREMLEDVGGFDERFFMYYEDLDLAWRARLRGWSFRYAPRSVVYHAHCGTSGEGSPFFVYHVERNRVFVAIKNGPPRLVVRGMATLAAKTAREWWRVAVRRGDRARRLPRARAYLRAGGSLARHLPAMLAKRFRIRVWRRKVSDRDLSVWLSPAPPSTRCAA